MVVGLLRPKKVISAIETTICLSESCQGTVINSFQQRNEIACRKHIPKTNKLMLVSEIAVAKCVMLNGIILVVPPATFNFHSGRDIIVGVQ